MSRFTKELRVIPKAAWIVAWFAYLCITRAVVLLRGTNGSGDGQIAALGSSAAHLRIFPAPWWLGLR